MVDAQITKLAHNIPKLYVIQGLKASMIVMPIITLFFQENGLSMQDIFVLQAVFSIAAIITEIPSGYLSDKIGHKRAIVLGLIVATFGMFVYTISYGFWMILLAEIVLGIGYAFVSGADSALLYNSLLAIKREDEHKKIESRLISIGGFSQAIGGILGAFLATITLRTPFFIEAVIMLITIPIGLSLIEPAVKKAKDTSANIWQEMMQIVSYSLHGHKQLKWIIIYAGTISTSTLAFVWFMQPYWQLVDIPIIWFGVLWAVLNVSIGIFAPLAHKFEEVFGLRKALISLVVLVAIAYMILGLYPTLVAVPAILIFYFVRAVQQPILRDYVHKIIDSDIRATVLSIKNLVGRLIFVVIGPILGYASDALTLPSALIISSITFFILGVIPLFFLHKHKAL